MPPPKKVAERIKGGLKKFRKVLQEARNADRSEQDTVTIVTDMLADVFGYDKYEELTGEYAIRGTYCDLAVKLDGKVTNGLVRHSEKYRITGVADSTKAGMDAGEFLDGVKNGIPVFRDLEDAIEKLGYVPKYFIYGIAPLASLRVARMDKVV